MVDIQNRQWHASGIYCGVAVLFHIEVKETLSGSFVYYGILIEFLGNLSSVAGRREIFYIYLPFYIDGGRETIRF